MGLRFRQHTTSGRDATGDHGSSPRNAPAVTSWYKVRGEMPEMNTASAATRIPTIHDSNVLGDTKRLTRHRSCGSMTLAIGDTVVGVSPGPPHPHRVRSRDRNIVRIDLAAPNGPRHQARTPACQRTEHREVEA